jgi:predicted transcriptional regulator
MKLQTYLESRGETPAQFARRTGIPRTTVARVIEGWGCHIDTAVTIVQASNDQKARGGGTVRYEDLRRTLHR